ncbi:PAS domain-containing hybrid sensor histidine kinase/response regulator [Hydrogenovibrio kuenenii]|uniref:PAS domain-containing hybrid sensor histidine kinase/response regulator n=1 Tax=Hydrogenovibrio kuenenii TaxID=63658 RepID=UPI0004651115|nr:PAS domain-containing hybrid sensor histidine kinase/response regulator [Hydrogenovibrio kuenenii]
MTNASERMIIDVSTLHTAVAYIEKDDDLNLSVIWQNKAADALWDQYDLNRDVDLKLQIIQAFSNASPVSFTHHLKDSVQPCRFVMTEFNQGLLAQFFYGNVRETDRKHSHKSIHEMMLETSKTCGLELDLNTHHVSYTQNFYEICSIDYSTLGHDFEQFLDRVHPLERQKVEDIVQSHVDVSWAFDVEFRFKNVFGNYTWLAMTAKTVSSTDDEELTHMIATLQNISDKKTIEQTLKTREQLIVQILDSLPISIYVKDENGCYRFFSQQAELELGFSRKKVIGKTDFELLSPKLAKRQHDEDISASHSGQIMISEEKICADDKEESCKWFLRGKGPINIQVDDYQQTWILGFLVDITNQKDAEHKLIDAKDVAEKALKAKADFLSIMSHEIRTPLNTVIGGAQLLMMNDFDEEYRSQIEMIHHSGVHLLNLINDILDFSKMEAQKLELEEIPFDLRQLAEIVVKMNSHLVEEKGLNFELQVENDLAVQRLGDAARLRQVLLNLINNAVKFTEKGNIKLKVTSAKKADNLFVRFEVSDTGIGITEEQKQKLFNEYVQAETSINRKYGGTGLGLLICQKIVDLMAGKIGVDSKVGEGTTFWLEVPLPISDTTEIDSQSSGEGIDSSEIIGAKSLSILIAEDNQMNQVLIRSILEKLGHKPVIVNNGLEALEIIQSNQYFDLVLMDLNMPEMGGIEATKAIRALGDKVSNIPIIALTADAFDSAEKAVFESGMNDYLTKPINMSDLGRVLDTWGNKTY